MKGRKSHKGLKALVARIKTAKRSGHRKGTKRAHKGRKSAI